MSSQSTETLQHSTTQPTVDLTIVLPCLNEAETLATCIDKARHGADCLDFRYEVVVADNGSEDGSQQIALDHGARVVDVPIRGYGAALDAGIRSANGTYVIMADADDSYALDDLEPFMRELENGADLVVGNRFKGGIEPGAMPWLHRYVGNPVLSYIGRLLFRTGIGDFHCGLRGFRRDAVVALDLQTTGMEFASEMIVKASLENLEIREVPTVLRPDGRSRPPHLNTWGDGWRHLRFMLLLSPRWLFLVPGVVLVVTGALGMALLLPGAISVGSIEFDIHALLYAHLALIIGVQVIFVGAFVRVAATSTGLLPPDHAGRGVLKRFRLEPWVLAGVVLLLAGIAGSIVAVAVWGSQDFGGLDASETMRLVVPSVTAVAIGAEVILGSLAFGVLAVDRR